MENKIVVLGNGSDWCGYSLHDLQAKEKGRLINSRYPFPEKGILNTLLRAHYSQKLNRWFELPGKTLWYRPFCRYICKDRNCNLVLVIYDRNQLANNVRFLKYLRRYFPNLSLVYVFTNVVRISGASNNNFVSHLKEYYDVVYAFDPGDAPRYGFRYTPLVYSRNPIDDVHPQHNVFYVGRAKDRYEMLMRVYAKLKEAKINRLFYIFGVDAEKQQFSNEITYNQLIPYKKVLRHIQEADCLLDVIQGESEGFTIKVCEAVFYDKLLITTNEKIKSAPFYDPRYILVIQNEQDIDPDFLDKAKKVRYSEEARAFFSVETFLGRILCDVGRKHPAERE